MRQALGLAAVLLAAGCGGGATDTALVVSIDSELRHPTIDKIEVRVVTAGDDKAHPFAVEPGTSFPLSLAIVPDGAPNFSVDLVVTASKEGRTVVGQTARVGFNTDQRTDILLLLAADCVGHSCGQEQSCVKGRTCVAVTAVVGAQPTDGGVPPMVADAGVDRPVERFAPPGQWTQVMASEIPSAATLNAVWPVRSDDVWVVGQMGARGVAYHWDGRAFTPATLPAGAPALTGVWASGSDVWLVGYSGAVLRRMDNEFRMVMAPAAVVLTGVWGFGANDIWVVGRGATAQRWNGSAWMPSTGVSGELLALTGLPGGELWAVGSAGGVFRHTAAGGWERQAAGLTPNPLYAVWASTANDVWAVGEQVALRFDGRAWARVSGTPESTLGVWGSRAGDVWAVGTQPGASPIAHFDGVGWSSFPSPVQTTLQRVRGLSANDVWAVGSAGIVLRYTAP